MSARDDIAQALTPHDVTFFAGDAWTNRCMCGATVQIGGMELHRADAVLERLGERGLDLDAMLTRARDGADARGNE